MNMTKSQAIEYLLSLKGGSITPGLTRVEELLKRMGNPQESLKFIHIAGTNGKGSTLCFISEILKDAGYKVGRYVSPAVSDYCEKYQVGGKSISSNMLIKGAELVREKIDEMIASGYDSPSSFEAETALSFWFYKEKKCDFVVLETGMGGLEDATNVIKNPLVCVLASVSYDHMAFLGDTLSQIAMQKAGIIKPGAHVVSAKQHDEAENVIKNKAVECGCKLSIVDMDALQDKTVSENNRIHRKQLFSYKNHKRLSLSLLGKYQLKNAALAIEAIEALKSQNIKISDDSIRNGLKNAVWPGRFQIVSEKPLIILDGAHNEEAAQRLAETIRFYFTNTRIVYIMGMLKDKEYGKVCEITTPLADCIFTISTPNNSRALDRLELAETVRKSNSNVTAADSIEEAVEMAKLMAGPDGVVIAFGSLSYLGKMMELTNNGSGKNKRSR